MAERSLRSIIGEIHQHDHTLTLDEISRRAGCDKKYVSVCLSQLGRKIGVQGSDKPEKVKQAHNLFQPYAFKQRRNESCCFVWVDGGKLHRCFAPTDGHTYCPDCLSEMGQRHAGSRFASIRSNGKWSHMA